MKRLILLLMLLTAGFASVKAQEAEKATQQVSPDKEANFQAFTDIQDEALAETLGTRINGIIGRTGCGGDDAAYLLVPRIEVDETEQSSGMIRNVTLVKGALTLMAVSRDDPNAIWHSARIPLQATFTGEGEDPTLLLAKKINVNDAVYVRFIRVARKKIAEAHAGPHQLTEP